MRGARLMGRNLSLSRPAADSSLIRGSLDGGAVALSIPLFVLLCVFVCLSCLGAFGAVAQGETLGENIVESNGIRYQLTQDKAIIIGFSDGAETARLPATLRGLPTAAPEDQDEDEEQSLGEVEELILEEGITSCESYLGLRNARIRRVTLPGTLVLFPRKEDSWFLEPWFGCFPWVQEITFPANLTREDFGYFLGCARWAYDASCYDVLYQFMDWEFWREEGDSEPSVEDVRFHWLSHVRIPPENPFLYDVDGVVFNKETHGLIACMPGRSGGYAVPEGTTSIGREAFQYCNMLESISLPRSVTAIGEGAFDRCAALWTLGLPPTVREIGANAFLNCVSLDTFILPDGVRVDANAFQYCTGLRALYAPGAESVIDRSALRTCSPELVVYANKDTTGYRAAAANDLLWAEIGGEPVRLYDPAWIPTAIVHDEDASASLPLYAEAEGMSQVLGRYPVGTTARVLGIGGGWAHVQFYEGEGYMPLDSLRLADKSDEQERVLILEAYEMGKSYTFYTAPSLSAPTVPIREWYYDAVQRYGTWYMLKADGETYYAPVNEVYPKSMCAIPAQLYAVSGREGSRARLYEHPDKTSRSLGVYYNGTQVEVVNEDPEDLLDVWSDVEEDNGFLHVRVDGKDGYMEEGALVALRPMWYLYGR